MPQTIILVALVTLVACVIEPEPILMKQSARESLRNVQEIQLLSYEPASFLVPQTVTPQVFGSIGYAVGHADALSRAHKMIEEFGVTDPVVQIKKEFVPLMQNSLGIATLSEVGSPISDDSLQTLRNELGQGYLLDFKTTKWELRYDHYGDYAYVVYQGRARLVNIPEEKVLWQGLCDLHEEDSRGKPSTEDFEANNGTLLKEYLARLATSCTAEFHKQLVGTQAPP